MYGSLVTTRVRSPSSYDIWKSTLRILSCSMPTFEEEPYGRSETIGIIKDITSIRIGKKYGSIALYECKPQVYKTSSIKPRRYLHGHSFPCSIGNYGDIEVTLTGIGKCTVVWSLHECAAQVHMKFESQP